MISQMKGFPLMYVVYGLVCCLHIYLIRFNTTSTFALSSYQVCTKTKQKKKRKDKISLSASLVTLSQGQDH